MAWSLVPAYAYLVVLSAVLVVIDIRTRLLPNIWTLPAYPIFVALLALPSAMLDRWGSLVRAMLASVLTVVVLYILASIAPNGFGMGDVKLAGALALPLAWHSWWWVLMAIAGAFMLSAVVGLALMMLKRAQRTSLLPFGPYLIVSTWLVIALG